MCSTWVASGRARAGWRWDPRAGPVFFDSEYMLPEGSFWLFCSSERLSAS
jgi:hypothetical protein